MDTEITKIASITRGLTNRIEICVINNLSIYNFNIAKPNPKRVVERPYLPTLVIGEKGIVQKGMCRQEISLGGSNQNFGGNHYDLIERNKFNQVKELLGYKGLKTNEYDLYKVIDKDVEIDIQHINCGSRIPIDIDGTIYSSDTGYGGNTYSRPNNQIEGGGRWEELYKTARGFSDRKSGGISWKILLKDNTNHKLVLRFADYWENTRRFDIYINGEKRTENFNVKKRAGGTYRRTDTSLRIPINTNELQLDLVGNSILNAIDVYKLDKGDVEFMNIDRNHELTNKEVFLFVNKNINVSEQTLKNKFLSIQNSILKNRNSFFF